MPTSSCVGTSVFQQSDFQDDPSCVFYECWRGEKLWGFWWDFRISSWNGLLRASAQLDICKSNRRHLRKLQECTNSLLQLHLLLILICRQSLLHHSNSLWGVDENPIWPRSNCGRLTPCKELINSHNSLGSEPVCSDTPSSHTRTLLASTGALYVIDPWSLFLGPWFFYP